MLGVWRSEVVGVGVELLVIVVTEEVRVLSAFLGLARWSRLEIVSVVFIQSAPGVLVISDRIEWLFLLFFVEQGVVVTVAEAFCSC